MTDRYHDSMMGPREYVIYTDESDKAGNYFSNFYGGVLVQSPDLQPVVNQLENCKLRLYLMSEVKWQKVTENYLAKYIELMSDFFDLIAADKVKVRIMFTQNRNVPIGLSQEQRRNEYFLLYYQFLKHAFGLPLSTIEDQRVQVRLNLDQLPSNREQNLTFKSYILRLNQNPQFRAARVRFLPDQIAEVDSQHHILLQCLDIVLGAMCFRLNDKHKEKLPSQRMRGKRTIAKERLYKFILGRIRQIYPNFNIGLSTSDKGDITNRWKHPYRHWKFIPKEFEIDGAKSKPK